MWTRYHIKCGNCEKVTNLRIQIPERTNLPVIFNCLGCSSELRAVLTVDLKKGGWGFKIEKGISVEGEFNSGDFFYEFSDVLATNKPSNKPHDRIMPTMRLEREDFKKLKNIKDKRKVHSKEEWQDFKDLSKAYVRFDKPILEKITKRIIGDLYPDKIFKYNNDLDYHRNYFLCLNYLVYPWIDFDNHSNYVYWLTDNIFNADNLKEVNLLDFIDNVTTEDLCNKLRMEISELIIRFIDLKEYFFYANNNGLKNEVFAAIQDFNKLKNFYTDSFEFIGRTSPLIFRLQNLFERGNQDNVPIGVPRNITSASTFAALDHGQKLDILNLSSEPILKLVYSKSFDNKLRNGINHFKAKLDPESQIISYYPITNRPNEEFQIKYIDFLNLCLDSFNSVLKIGQLIKIATVYKVAITTLNKKRSL